MTFIAIIPVLPWDFACSCSISWQTASTRRSVIYSITTLCCVKPAALFSSRERRRKACRPYKELFGYRLKQIAAQLLGANSLPFNSQPVHQVLLERGQPLKLLGQQVADTTKHDGFFSQERSNIPAKDLSDRLGHQFQGQRIAGITVDQVSSSH